MTLSKADFLVNRDYAKWQIKPIISRFNSKLLTVPASKVYGTWRILKTTNEPDIYILEFKNTSPIKVMYCFTN